jgi:RHS repeat-associated protein
MEGNWNGLGGKNKYQYNEKELNSDFGLDLSDYGARFYDAAIGRFPSVDPLSPVYARQTPYAYAANNPATMIDYMGMGPAGQGADGLTNEQWMSANRSADGNQNGRMSESRSSNRNEEVEEKRQMLKNGQSRAVTAADIALTMVVYNVYRSKTGYIYYNTYAAMYWFQKRSMLTYGGGGKVVSGPNRYNAQKDWTRPRTGLTLLGLSMEEYPYACTKEGGAGAITFPVPIKEQNIQRDELLKITSSLKEGNRIFVKLINNTGEPEPVRVLEPSLQDHPIPYLPILTKTEQILERAINIFLIIPSVQGVENNLPQRYGLPADRA